MAASDPHNIGDLVGLVLGSLLGLDGGLILDGLVVVDSVDLIVPSKELDV